jgi:hypothetical protein
MIKSTCLSDFELHYLNDKIFFLAINTSLSIVLQIYMNFINK